MKKATRTISGVTPVAVMAKPHPCPGDCVYCPSAAGARRPRRGNAAAAEHDGARTSRAGIRTGCETGRGPDPGPDVAMAVA